MQANWCSLLCLVLTAVLAESGSGQQAYYPAANQHQALPPIIQARDFQSSRKRMELSQPTPYQASTYQQPNYQQPAYQQRYRYQQAAYQQAAYQQAARQRTVYQANYLVPARPQGAQNPDPRHQNAGNETPIYPAQNIQSEQQEDPFRDVEDPFRDVEDPFRDVEDPFRDPPAENVLEQQDQQALDEPLQYQPLQDPPAQHQPSQYKRTLETPATQNPFADPQNAPMQQPAPRAHVSVPPAEPSLPGGVLYVPQITNSLQQAPVPPMPAPTQAPAQQPTQEPVLEPTQEPVLEPTQESALEPTQEPVPSQPELNPPAETYPPDSVVPPTDAQQLEAPQVVPVEPHAQPLPRGQRYPGQIPPNPSRQQPTTQFPMNGSAMSPRVGSPGPYVPQPALGPYFVQPQQQPYQQPMMQAMPYNPALNDQQMAPAQPNNLPPAYQPAVPSGCPGASPVYAGATPNEPGSYFDQNGAGCPTCSNVAPPPCASCPSGGDGYASPFYISVFGGGDFANNLTTDDNQTMLDFDSGGGVGVALGKIQGKNLRTDIEFTYRNSPFGAGSSNAVAGQLDGRFNTYSGMANMYWEFASFRATSWKPYVGGGIGFAFLDSTINSNSPIDSDSAFAYQWMAGLNYKFSCQTELFVEYRELYAHDLSIEYGGFNSDINFSTRNVFGGLRLKF